MGKNIFNIWDDIGQKLPFAVRRTHWSNKNIYVIVDKVEPDGKGYGKAYGTPVENGDFCSYWQTDKKWKEDRLIPNNGVYGWEYVENVTLKIKNNNYNRVNAKVVSMKEMKKPVNMVYDIDTNIDFGKYRNLEIKTIVTLNPNYLVWAIKNISKFKLSNKAINLLTERIEDKDEIVQINNKK